MVASERGMATLKTPDGLFSSLALSHTLGLLLLLFLGQFARGEGPGDTTVDMVVVEESAEGVVVDFPPGRSGI